MKVGKIDFGMNKVIKVVGIATSLLLFFSFPLTAQQMRAKQDTLKFVLTDSSLSDTTKIKTVLDSIPSNSIRVPPKLKKQVIDTVVTGEDLLQDSLLTIPTPVDTLNKIRLPVDLKKSKFAYFDASQSIERIIRNQAFDVGEKLTFDIRYGPIVAGSSTMAIPELVSMKGRQCYKIVTETRSSAFFSAFYRVRDRIESHVDRNGLFSWRFEKHLREGKYRSDQSVNYDQIRGWAVSNKKDSMRIPPCVQDILSSLYYVRTQELVVGKSLFIDNHSSNKLYPLEVKIHGKEKIKIKAGNFDCIVVEPILRIEGLFKSKGRLLIWLTDDERKIPVQMKSKIIVGNIIAELKEMGGVKENYHVGLR